MSPDQSLLAELAKVATKLNNSSDDVNRIIEDYQKQINDMKIGIPVWMGHRIECADALATDEESGYLVTTYFQLGFDKSGSTWCLMVRKYRRAASADGWNNEINCRLMEEQPLRDAPRSVRIEAITHFDDFTKVLIEQASKAVRTIEEKVTQS